MPYISKLGRKVGVASYQDIEMRKVEEIPTETAPTEILYQTLVGVNKLLVIGPESVNRGNYV